jgi:D-aminopeptidase
VLELRFRDHAKARWFGFYPSARQVDPLTVQLEADGYFDVLRALMFAM